MTMTILVDCFRNSLTHSLTLSVSLSLTIGRNKRWRERERETDRQKENKRKRKKRWEGVMAWKGQKREGSYLPFEPVTWYICTGCTVQLRPEGHKPCPPLCNKEQRLSILSSIHPTHSNLLHSLILQKRGGEIAKTKKYIVKGRERERRRREKREKKRERELNILPIQKGGIFFLCLFLLTLISSEFLVFFLFFFPLKLYFFFSSLPDFSPLSLSIWTWHDVSMFCCHVCFNIHEISREKKNNRRKRERGKRKNWRKREKEKKIKKEMPFRQIQEVLGWEEKWENPLEEKETKELSVREGRNVLLFFLHLSISLLSTFLSFSGTFWMDVSEREKESERERERESRENRKK